MQLLSCSRRVGLHRFAGNDWKMIADLTEHTLLASAEPFSNTPHTHNHDFEISNAWEHSSADSIFLSYNWVFGAAFLMKTTDSPDKH